MPAPAQKGEPPAARPPQPQRPPQRPPEKSPGGGKAGPGEFTRMFKVPGTPAPAPPAVQRPAAPQESEFTRFFKGNQLSTGSEVNWKEVEQRPEPPAETKAAGEFPSPDRFASSVIQVDEFAKIIAPRPASNQPQAATAAADDPEPSPNPKGPALAILLAVIAAVLLLAGCAIYFFVIRK